MSRTLRLALLVIAAVIVVGGGALGLVAWLGLVNIAAASGTEPGVAPVLATIRDRSIARHARLDVNNGRISPPPKITDELLAHGASEYREMCVICHGGPGVRAGVIGKGLEPSPPDLGHTAQEMNASEIYWVIENGIRHTGMPAFGATHDADTLWAVTAFVSRFKEMSADEFKKRMAAAEPDEPDEHTHEAPEHAHPEK